MMDAKRMTKDELLRETAKTVSALLRKSTDKYEKCRLVATAVSMGNKELSAYVALVFRLADGMRPLAIEMRG